MLRWADNPKHKISAYRVLKLMPGIGPKTAEKIFDYLTLHHFDFAALDSVSIGGEAKSAVTIACKAVA